MNSGTKYLVASLAGAANTLNAHQPLATNGVGIPPAWISATPTSELPLQAIAWQQVATAAFAAKGALRTRSGRLGFAISIASWAGLLHLHRVAQDSRVVLERTLVDGLGPTYRDAYDGVTFPPTELRFTRQQRVFPRPGRRNPVRAGFRPELRRVRRVEPPRHLGSSRSPARSAPPVLLQVHGGSWTMEASVGKRILS